MSYIWKGNALSILLGATVLFGAFWVVGQGSSDDEELADDECVWNFKHDPVISTFHTGNISATGSSTVNIPSSSSRDGYFYDECNGTIYRIEHNEDGQISSTAIDLS